MLLGQRYRLEQRVGTGGMGEVWRATDQVLHRTVAVKLMRPELVAQPGFADRFLAEARTMATIRHRGVVAVYDYHGDESGVFLVMEYVAGESLSHLLHRVGRLDPATTMNLMAQAAEALQAAHDRQVVHRDIKPGNLLVGEDNTLVLTDFGIARSAASTPVTATGAVLGTPAYLSPEQVLGKPATPLSDLYALGVVSYECLTGRRPFEGDNPFEIAMKRLNEPPPPLDPSIPPAVVAVVERALASDPERRWQTAAEFATVARQAVASGGGTAPTAVGPTAAVNPPPVRSQVAAPAPAHPWTPGYTPGRARPQAPGPVAPPTSYPPPPVRHSSLPSPPPPPWAPPPRPLTVLLAAILLRFVGLGLFIYSVATIAVLRTGLDLARQVYGDRVAEYEGGVSLVVMGFCGGAALLAGVYFLLAGAVSRGRPGARGWTFTLASLTLCCGLALAPQQVLDRLAERDVTADLARELWLGLPGWYLPVTGLALATVVVGQVVALLLLLIPPAGRYFRRYRAGPPYPPYPAYGYR